MRDSNLIERPHGVITGLSRVRLQNYFEVHARMVPVHVIESLLGFGHHGVCIACWTSLGLGELCLWGRRLDGLTLDGFAEGLVHDQVDCSQLPGIEVIDLTYEHLDELFTPLFARHASSAGHHVQEGHVGTVPALASTAFCLQPKKDKPRFIQVPFVRRNR